MVRVVLAAAILLVACGGEGVDEVADGSPGPRYVVEVGVIDPVGETVEVLRAPAVAVVGTSVSVVVSTFGNSCVSEHSIGVHEVADGFRLTPYDRRYTGPDGCADLFATLPHPTELVFSSPGEKTLTVRGRRVEGRDEDYMIELQQTIVIESP